MSLFVATKILCRGQGIFEPPNLRKELAYRERYTTTPDGTALFQRAWEVEDPRCRIVLVHGFADHSGRYELVARDLNAAGFSVYAFDLRGNGRSPGQPGLVSDYQQSVDDLRFFVDHVRSDGSGPIALLGHSFGGVVSILYSLDQTTGVDALVLSAPALRLVPNRLLQPFAPLLGRLAPGFSTPGVERDATSRDPAIVAAAKADPLVYNGRVTLLTGSQLVLAGRKAQAQAGDLRLPVLAIHGTADRIADHRATRAFVERCGSADKSYHELDGLYHEIMNEPERKEVIAMMTQFIQRVCRADQDAPASATTGSAS